MKKFLIFKFQRNFTKYGNIFIILLYIISLIFINNLFRSIITLRIVNSCSKFLFFYIYFFIGSVYWSHFLEEALLLDVSILF